MFEVLAVATMLLSSYLLVRSIGAKGVIEFVLVFFCISTAQIAVWGYLLSSVNHLGDVRYWAAFGMITLFVNAVIAFSNRSLKQFILPHISLTSLSQRFASFKKWYLNETSRFEKLLLTPLIVIVASLGLLNLAIVLFTAPHNVDSMTYHLARMAYYLQHNNFNYYPANYWAQVVHPKNSTLLLLYSYLVSGRNENMTQLVQFFSYWISMLSVYGIVRKTGNSRTYGIFAAMVSALLVEWLLESTTTQNDMIITAYFGSAVCFLFSFRETRQRKYLTLAALGIGLSIGMSAKSFLVLPSVILVAFYVLFQKDARQKRLSNLSFFVASISFAVIIFALPAGYFENYRTFGNPLGPEQIREHSFEGKSMEYIVKGGTINLLRFGFDFIRLDGLPPIDIVDKAQLSLAALPKVIIGALGIDLETSEAALKPFSFAKNYELSPNEDWSYWGVMGFALIWIMVLLSAAGVIKGSDARILSFAAILFLLVQAFAGMYDPHRGRYFCACAVFAVPTIGVILRSGNKFIRVYVLIVVLLGCISAVSTVVLQPNRALISVNYQNIHRISVFHKDRIGQLTANNVPYYLPIKAFDSFVPRDATVAVFLKEDAYEYPLFGKYLTRRIIPVNSFDKGFQGVPSNADYLLFGGVPRSRSFDHYLGEDWYLWKLR